MKISIIKNMGLFLVGSLALFSCEKDQFLNEATDDQSTAVEFRNEDYDDCDVCDVEYCHELLLSIASDGEMLYFSDAEEMYQTEICLRRRVEAHVEAFTSLYADEDDDTFNAIADELGYKEAQPLDEQEALWGITSIRTSINAAVDLWLDESGYNLEIANSPDNFLILDDEQRTLINSDGYVSVGGEVINYNPLRKASDPEDDGECKSKVTTKESYEFDDGDNKIIVTISSLTSAFRQKAQLKIEHFEWSSIKTKWKRDRTDITAEIDGEYRNIHCDGPGEDIFEDGAKRTKTLTISDGYSLLGGKSQGRVIQKGCNIIGEFTVHSTPLNLCL